MDEAQLQDDIKGLQKQVEEYERLLSSVGVECKDMPDDVCEILDKCCTLQQVTHLQDLKEIYLQQWLHTKRKENIDYNLEAKILESELFGQELEIQRLRAEQKSLKSFIAEPRRILTEATMTEMKAVFETRVQHLIATQETLQCPSDINLDDLINKIDILNRKC